MASTQEFVDYVIDQIGLSGMRCRKMFGEFGLYLEDKVIGFVCDDIFFVKILPENGDLAGDLKKGPAYPGSKDYYIVDENHFENREWLQSFIQVTAEAVPMKIKKVSKKKK